MASAHTRHSATIASTATAVPPNILTLEDVKFYMRKVFDVGERRLDAMMTVIDHAQVRKRHSVFPVEYFVTPRSL
jgi:predicted naringenin-chalcone synthase